MLGCEILLSLPGLPARLWKKKNFFYSNFQMSFWQGSGKWVLQLALSYAYLIFMMAIPIPGKMVCIYWSRPQGYLVTELMLQTPNSFVYYWPWKVCKIQPFPFQSHILPDNGGRQKRRPQGALYGLRLWGVWNRLSTKPEVWLLWSHSGIARKANSSIRVIGSPS